MIVALSVEAESDLEAIADFIAKDNPARALSFVQELRASCRSLADMPMGYPLVLRYEKQGIRRRVHGNYQIFYRVDGEQVHVVRVLHGARDYEALL
ncbi:type II toxin-antitoxin system RelE/ParE family toxin [Inquilinus limosus]|uniref:type II toxin-antitoxin system RelE/ParE family toxin n=1 Tax=Inquilinus limosus TaxID=171674 RepID=UPI003F14559D